MARSNIDLEHWMRDLPEQIKNLPFIYLAIPGKFIVLCRSPILTANFNSEKKHYLVFCSYCLI